jgi:tRNA-binding protein
VDIRVGRVTRAEPNEGARKPSIKLWIDFGPLGEKKSSAQLAALYSPEDLSTGPGMRRMFHAPHPPYRRSAF